MTGPSAWFASAPQPNAGCYVPGCLGVTVGYRHLGEREWVEACREHKDLPTPGDVTSGVGGGADRPGFGESPGRVFEIVDPVDRLRFVGIAADESEDVGCPNCDRHDAVTIYKVVSPAVPPWMALYVHWCSAGHGRLEFWLPGLVVCAVEPTESGSHARTGRQ